MSYSNSIKNIELEPVYHSNTRTEWRFEPDRIYSTNVLIGLLAVDKTTASFYNRLAGSAGMIDNIMLLDGNVELQLQQLAGQWYAWKQTRKSNAHLKDKSPLLNGSNSGVRYEGDGSKVLKDAIPDPSNQIKTNTGKTTLPVSDFLSILEAMSYIDTSVFKNLRLIVEYSMDGVVRNNNGETLTPERPLLLLEEVVAEQQKNAMMGKVGNIAFTNIEADRVLLPEIIPTANDTTAAQNVSFHINSYSNKKVGKFLMVKHSQNSANYIKNTSDIANGEYDSTGLYKESTQIRVNGGNLFPKSGISDPNKRLARLVDTWGSGCLATFANGLPFKAADGVSRGDTVEGGASKCGYADWFGCDLGFQEVQDFQFEFGRQGVFCKSTGDAGNDPGQTAASKYNSAIDLLLFAETRKVIVMSGSSYNVMYA